MCSVIVKYDVAATTVMSMNAKLAVPKSAVSTQAKIPIVASCSIFLSSLLTSFAAALMLIVATSAVVTIVLLLQCIR